MKKKYLLLISIFVVCFSFFSLQTKAEDKGAFPAGIGVQPGEWYYIQSSMSAGTSISEANRIGRYLTSQGAEKQALTFSLYSEGQRDLQLWKIEADAANGSDRFFIINKATGFKLSLGTGTEKAAELATTSVRNLPSNDDNGSGNYTDRYYTSATTNTSFKIETFQGTDYPCAIIYGQSANFLAAQNDKGGLQDASGTNNPPSDPTLPPHTARAWMFIPQSEVDNRYNVMSTATETKWYQIESVLYPGKVLYENDGVVAVKDKDNADNTQLWKFMPTTSTTGGGNVYIVNKSKGTYIQNPGLTNNAGLLTAPFDSQCTLQDLLRTDNTIQFRISGGFSITGTANACAVLAETEAVKVSNATNSAGFGYGSAYAFHLNFVSTGNSIKGTSVDSFEVSAENGYITVSGTTDTYKVYTICGVEVNPAAKQANGIYIVKVGNTSKKVYVK